MAYCIGFLGMEKEMDTDGLNCVGSFDSFGENMLGAIALVA